MPKYFGTDGIRAKVGDFPLTEDFVIKLGYCALLELQKHGDARDRARTVIIAEDSRQSGPQLAQCLSRGITAAGFDVLHVGIAPTPAVAFLTHKKNAVCGIVISASHNPAEFNGIKFFSHTGKKLNEDIEILIETAVENTAQIPAPAPYAKVVKDAALLSEYTDFLKSTVPAGISFKGIKAVLDCANGASYKTAPQIFRELGVETIVINDNPDGVNINDNAGALYTEGMQKAVAENKAFIGFSFDGDADRLIAADEEGGQLDGDDIMAAAALHLKKQGRLRGGKIALTVMTNLGLINYLKQNGVEPVLTAVGDKYVFEALEKEDLSLGGETSGHVIFRDILGTGDGTLCALQLLAIVIASGHKPSWLKKQWRKYPLKLIPVKVSRKPPLESVPGFVDYIGQLEEQMGTRGRIFARYSGTEPLLRILVEGEDKNQVEDFAQKVADFYIQKTK
jgi:phosphoglucosamine mutase